MRGVINHAQDPISHNILRTPLKNTLRYVMCSRRNKQQQH